ncbi:MAG: hypothetical protein LBR24_02745 [Methanobrevibacter sp.]|nr:hypothetical protein [Methanobrevibacter sp.]
MVEEKIAQIELDNLVFYLKNKLKEKNIYLNKYHAQKALFKIKMDLGEDHPLYDCLPYYWYYYGPFSEPVADSFNYILDNRGDFTPKDISIEYPEVEDIVNGLIKNKNFFYNELPKFIYKKYAPYAVLYDFPFNIYDFAAKK